MKLFDLLVDGYHTPRTAEDIAELFRAGRLRKDDPCRIAGTKDWKTVDELFPLLKYDSRRLTALAPSNNNSAITDRRDWLHTVPPAMTSALKAGWICFGIGLAISWFFPLGNAFFTVAIIAAVVAMCTHQVNRGLALLISSFVGVTLCAVMFFGLAFGAVVITGAAAMEKAKADLKRSPVVTSQQTFAQLNAAVQQPQIVPPTTPSPRVMANNVTLPRPAARPIPTAPPEDRTKRDTVRQAEMERDRSNAKEQRIQQLQKSIDWYDEQIRNVRGYGGNESIFVKQRDDLVRQKWDLQR